MELRIDLHLHTTLSQDSIVTLEDAIEGCRRLGLDGFAVTNHDVLTRIPESALDDSGLIILPGIEIKAEGIHIGAFDIHELIEGNLSLGETIDRIHDQGGFAVICHAHSVLGTWLNRENIVEAGFDLVEVANAYQFPYWMMVELNRRLARRLRLPETGGSDSHIPDTVGRAYTVLEAEERSTEGVLDALRKGRCRGEGRGISLGERMKWPKIRV
jgi:predicted metal-dependent phosphoesterase TrpH